MAVHHDHWRESYFFVAHPPAGEGDVVILAMAHFPAREELDALQLGRVGGQFVFARHARPYGDDPHTTTVGPASVEVVEPYRKLRLRVEEAEGVPLSLDLAFEARTAPYGMRRGTMKRKDEIIWDQSHMIQAGRFDGAYTWGGRAFEVDGWWGQRDHSWGIRDHARCPLWMWLAIQLPDGMLGVWHWEYANGAPVFTDGCFAPAGGADPVPLVDFRHDLSWTDGQGRPVSWGRDGEGVQGLAGTVQFTLADGTTVTVEGEGSWAARYGPLGGGQSLMKVRTPAAHEQPVGTGGVDGPAGEEPEQHHAHQSANPLMMTAARRRPKPRPAPTACRSSLRRSRRARSLRRPVLNHSDRRRRRPLTAPSTPSPVAQSAGRAPEVPAPSASGARGCTRDVPPLGQTAPHAAP